MEPEMLATVITLAIIHMLAWCTLGDICLNTRLWKKVLRYTGILPMLPLLILLAFIIDDIIRSRRRG